MSSDGGGGALKEECKWLGTRGSEESPVRHITNIVFSVEVARLSLPERRENWDLGQA